MTEVFTPRPYQIEAVQAIETTLAQGIRRQLLVLPTGTGKTLIFADCIRRRPGRSLVLVHRDELVYQTLDKLSLVAADLQVGVVKAERNDTQAHTIVATVQTLARPRRLDQLPRDFRTIVVDEAHHATADTYRRILGHLYAWDPQGPLVLGCTATATRTDRQSLAQVFTHIVYQKTLLEMMGQEYLCDLRAVRVALAVDLDTVRQTGAGDFAEAELGQRLLEADAPRHIVEAWHTHAVPRHRRRTLVFTPSVDTALVTAQAFREAGIAAEAIHGGTPTEERHALLNGLYHGTLPVLVNCAVLTEGFDEPALDCVVIARPTLSALLYCQMIGRGTRRWPGKEYCLILDVVGATERYDLQTVATLVDLTPEELHTQSVLEAYEARLARRERQRREREAALEVPEAPPGRLVGVEAALFTRGAFHWVETPSGAWVMSLASDGMVRLKRETAEPTSRWLVQHLVYEDTDTLYRGLPLAYALGAAESWVRQFRSAAVARQNAAWRALPATERQESYVRRLGYQGNIPATRGETSDLILRLLGDR